MRNPTDAGLAVTYRCNGRCVMCNIWKGPQEEEISPDCYEKLPSSLRTINVSGGEPFLRDDLSDIIRILKKRCPRSKIIISTNGLLPEKIERVMRQVIAQDRDMGVALSLDGTEDLHDEIRGARNSYRLVLETLRRLRSIGARNVRFSFTILRENVKEMRRVYHLARSSGIEFTTQLAQGSAHYFKIEIEAGPAPEILKEELRHIMRSELMSVHPKRWFRAYYLYGLHAFASERMRIAPCTAGRDFFFMSPSGNIYPCNVLNYIVGNIQTSPFTEIWGSAITHAIRRHTAMCPQRCWMICSARTSIAKKLIPALGWIVRKQLLSAMGREAL